LTIIASQPHHLAVEVRNLPPNSLAGLEQRLYRGSESSRASASSAARTANTFIFARPMILNHFDRSVVENQVELLRW
jgi:hypothetical protein